MSSLRFVARVGLMLFLPLFLGAGLSRGAAEETGGNAASQKIVPWLKSRTLKVYEELTLIRGPLFGAKRVIRDEAMWKTLVAQCPELAKLKVDFSKQMVLAVGEMPRGRGKFLSHVEVTETLACIPQVSAVLHYFTTPPGEPVLADIIWPSHFIVVDASASPVHFSEVTENPWLVPVPATTAAP